MKSLIDVNSHTYIYEMFIIIYMFIIIMSLRTCIGKCKCMYGKHIYITIYVCVIYSHSDI